MNLQEPYIKTNLANQNKNVSVIFFDTSKYNNYTT